MVASPPPAFLSTILRNKREEKKIVQKQVLDKLSIYIPQPKTAEMAEKLVELAGKKDRSINYLVVEGILECLNREEKTGQWFGGPCLAEVRGKA